MTCGVSTLMGIYMSVQVAERVSPQESRPPLQLGRTRNFCRAVDPFRSIADLAAGCTTQIHRVRVRPSSDG